MNDIQAYNTNQETDIQQICNVLAQEIQHGLLKADSKIWHGAPVWFLDGNPIVGYTAYQNKQQGRYIRLMFWSGADFDEPQLELGTGKFKDAHIDYTAVDQVHAEDLARWLQKSEKIQWDYKNIVKRKGLLEPLK